MYINSFNYFIDQQWQCYIYFRYVDKTQKVKLNRDLKLSWYSSAFVYTLYILKLVKSIENILKYLLFLFSRCTHVSSIFNAPYKKDKYEHNNNACHAPRATRHVIRWRRWGRTRCCRRRGRWAGGRASWSPGRPCRGRGAWRPGTAEAASPVEGQNHCNSSLVYSKGKPS